MTATKADMIPLKSITIAQAEGPSDQLLKGAYVSFGAANQLLCRIREHAPRDGSYYKTDVHVEWEDGFKLYVREDVSDDNTYKADVADSIRATWLHYAGLRKPSHMSEEQYEALTDNTKRKDEATGYLKKYSLTDTPASQAGYTNWPTKGELRALSINVAELLARVEDPVNKEKAFSVRTISLELRKAIAALERAQNVT